MINVVCYCGCEYSFADEVGSCPRCGEHVFSARRSQAREETIAMILAHASGGPEELAA